MKKENKKIRRPITSTSLSIGLVGLPNVGKSHLFNLLTNSSIPSQNYPFCTIEPHIAITNLITKDIEYLNSIFKPIKTTPIILSFKDIAGLIKDSHKGSGLGNKFLMNIRESHSILHIIRCFKDEDVIHISNTIEPINDYKTIRNELLYSDCKYLYRKYKKHKLSFKSKKMTQQDLDLTNLYEKILINFINQLVEEEEEIDFLEIFELDVSNYSDYEILLINQLDFLSLKNQVICLNVSKSEFIKLKFSKTTAEFIKFFKSISNDSICLFSENSISPKLLPTIYNSLSLITMYTCGPKEVRAYTMYPGTLITDAAALIHSDFSKYFISADVYNINDLREHSNEAAVKKAGKIRNKGKTYEVVDGDIVRFNANVPNKKK